MICFILLVMFSKIDQSFSAVFWSVEKPQSEDYNSLRSGSFHRGLLFSLTVAQKHELCLDYFSAQLYLGRVLGGEKVESEMMAEIDDGEKRSGLEEPRHDLIVHKVGLTYAGELIQDQSEVYFKCVGRSMYIDIRRPHHFGVYHISYAFRFGFFFDNFLEFRYDDDTSKNIMNQVRYFSLSPEYHALELHDLERQYALTRRTMQELRKESSNYVELIRRRDNLSPLSRWQKLFLCASVLSSPTYRIDRLEFSFGWVDEVDDESLRYQPRYVKFKHESFTIENFTDDCIICKGYTNANKPNKSTDLCLTRSYDDKNSLYVLKQEAEGLFVSKYFRYVPLLEVSKKPLNEGMLYKNYESLLPGSVSFCFPIKFEVHCNE